MYNTSNDISTCIMHCIYILLLQKALVSVNKEHANNKKVYQRISLHNLEAQHIARLSEHSPYEDL